MNTVDFVVLRIRVGWLIEQLARGPKFTRLPPANYYHNHVNEKKDEHRPGMGAYDRKGGRIATAYARRKWMRDLTIASPLQPQPPVPQRMPARQYVYRSFENNPGRKAMAIKILRAVLEQGEVCNVAQQQPYATPDCNRDCRCIVPVKRDGANHIIKHKGPHVCAHYTWRYSDG